MLLIGTMAEDEDEGGKVVMMADGNEGYDKGSDEIEVVIRLND